MTTDAKGFSLNIVSVTSTTVIREVSAGSIRGIVG